MNIFQTKIEKQETIVTRLLRKQLINIDDTLKLVKIENEELKELILKQQKMINKLHEQNVKLSRKAKNECLVNEYNNQLIDCNSSLKQQLLVSQNQNSMLLHDLHKSQCEINYLHKELSKK
jgi:hypothetical protein